VLSGCFGSPKAKEGQRPKVAKRKITASPPSWHQKDTKGGSSNAITTAEEQPAALSSTNTVFAKQLDNHPLLNKEFLGPPGVATTGPIGGGRRTIAVPGILSGPDLQLAQSTTAPAKGAEGKATPYYQVSPSAVLLDADMPMGLLH
jgi:hypothetical protein